MTDIEMKDDKASPATEEKKVEEHEEPQDHFFGKFHKTSYWFRTQENIGSPWKSRHWKRLPSMWPINQKFEKT